MTAYELTHRIHSGMPVYPGIEPPTLRKAFTIEKDGFVETEFLTFTSHVGTHMDAPGHIYPGAAKLDSFPPSQFVGSACVIDCRGLMDGARIRLEHIKQAGAMVDEAEFLLFRTGWDQYWGDEKYFRGYPCFDEETVRHLAGLNKKGIGVDAISVDTVEDTATLPNHHILLAGGQTVILENLCDLGAVGEGLFQLLALPLYYEDADGSPIRAIGIRGVE